MKRTALQSWTLGIWLAGFIVLEVVVLVAVLRFKVDAFQISAAVVDHFEGAFTSADSGVRAEVKKGLSGIASGKVTARTAFQFREHLQRYLPKAVSSEMLDWLVDNCAENRVSSLQLTYLQIYLPWLAVMIAGLLGENSNQRVSITKARASLASSAVLQLLFLMFLVSTLLIGDLSATRNIELVATLVTALVGTLVQFVFPAAPEIPQPSSPKPAEG